MVEDEFIKYGDTFKLVFHEEPYVIYQRGENHFEVMRYKIATKTSSVNGNVVTQIGDIKLPSSSYWGATAYTLYSLDECMDKISEMKVRGK